MKTRSGAQLTTPPETDLSGVMQRLGQVLTRVGLHRTRTGSDTGLTSLQLTALSAIGRRPGLTIGVLSREMMTAPSAVSRLISGLSRQKLVRRVRDHKDRRVLRLSLTPTGQQIVAQLRLESQLLMGRVLSKMTPAEIAALGAGLDSLLRAVSATEREVFQACARDECQELVPDDQ